MWKYSYYTPEIGTSILCQVLKMKVRRPRQEARGVKGSLEHTVRDSSGTATVQGECPTSLGPLTGPPSEQTHVQPPANPNTGAHVSYIISPLLFVP